MTVLTSQRTGTRPRRSCRRLIEQVLRELTEQGPAPAG